MLKIRSKIGAMPDAQELKTRQNFLECAASIGLGDVIETPSGSPSSCLHISAHRDRLHLEFSITAEKGRV
jgi:hypothetical protein